MSDSDSEYDRIKKQRELDEARTSMVDTFPKLWWGMFTELKKEGFLESQALELLKTWILSMGNK